MENNVINCSNIVELPVKDLEIKRFGHTLTLSKCLILYTYSK